MKRYWHCFEMEGKRTLFTGYKKMVSLDHAFPFSTTKSSTSIAKLIIISAFNNTWQLLKLQQVFCPTIQRCQFSKFALWYNGSFYGPLLLLNDGSCTREATE